MSKSFAEYVSINPDNGCWEWQGTITRDGYGRLGKQSAHRHSWTIYSGPIPNGMLVCHHCDNRRCVNPGHLFLGTPLDNSRDMVAKGRSPKWNGQRRGAGNPRANLDEHMVRQIRRLRGRITLRELGKKFGVNHSTISDIFQGRTWTHV